MLSDRVVWTINNDERKGADGANSFVRQNAQFNVTKWDHDQMAIIATLKLAEVVFTHCSQNSFLVDPKNLDIEDM